MRIIQVLEFGVPYIRDFTVGALLCGALSTWSKRTVNMSFIIQSWYPCKRLLLCNVRILCVKTFIPLCSLRTVSLIFKIEYKYIHWFLQNRHDLVVAPLHRELSYLFSATKKSVFNHDDVDWINLTWMKLFKLWVTWFDTKFFSSKFDRNSMINNSIQFNMKRLSEMYEMAIMSKKNEPEVYWALIQYKDIILPV